MESDVLSDVLRAVRLSGSIYFDNELTSPWVTQIPPSREIAQVVMPGAQRVIEYHLMARGSGWGHIIGGEAIRLAEGDVIVFPQGDGHVLSSQPGMHAELDMSLYARPTESLPLFYQFGGGGSPKARVVCGFLGFDERPYNPLLTSLPAVIHLSAQNPRAATGWLGTLLGISVQEASNSRPGRQNILSRLSELMFVDTIRQYLETLPPSEKGWLAGLREPIIGRALSALHQEPRRSWTVEELARVVGLSRSVLAERFTEMVGHPPMHYLALWRMQLASRMLLDGGQVAAVALDVGYESEAAFSRAFKKLVGQSPSTWKKSAASATTIPPV